MSYSMKVALISLACIFGGALLGKLIRRLLPEHHLSGKSEDALKVGAGMILEMNRPLDGIIKVSSAPMLKALQFLGQ